MTATWLASVAIPLAFIALVLLGARPSLRRRSDDVDTVVWVLVSSIAGGSMSAITLALI